MGTTVPVAHAPPAYRCSGYPGPGPARATPVSAVREHPVDPVAVASARSVTTGVQVSRSPVEETTLPPPPVSTANRETGPEAASASGLWAKPPGSTPVDQVDARSLVSATGENCRSMEVPNPTVSAPSALAVGISPPLVATPGGVARTHPPSIDGQPAGAAHNPVRSNSSQKVSRGLPTGPRASVAQVPAGPENAWGSGRLPTAPASTAASADPPTGPEVGADGEHPAAATASATIPVTTATGSRERLPRRPPARPPRPVSLTSWRRVGPAPRAAWRTTSGAPWPPGPRGRSSSRPAGGRRGRSRTTGRRARPSPRRARRR